MARRTLLTSAIVALCVVAIGCGGPSSTASSNTLRIAMGSPAEIVTDRGYDTDAFDILDQLYEPLVRYRADGTLGPALATSWDLSSDGRRMTFHLRPGVTFSDGTPFDSKAVEFNLRQWVGDRDNSFLGLTFDVAAMRTPDPRTFVLELKKAYYPALNELASLRPVRFMSPAGFDAKGELVKTIGTGPYKVASSTAKQTVLTRNASYWGGRPSLDRLVFKVIPDSQARVTALQAGEVDVIGGAYLSPLAPEEARGLKGNSDVKVLSEPSTTNLLLLFNTDNPLLADRPVREAFSEAVDRASLNKSLFDGLAPPANGEFPPNLPFTRSNNSVPRAFDAGRAREVLQAAGYVGNGVRSKGAKALTFKLILDPELIPQAKALSEAIQAELRDVGIDVQITPLEHTAYGAAVTKRKFDLRFYQTYGAPYDPVSLLQAGFGPHSSEVLVAGERLDALLPPTFASTTVADRQARYDAIWRYLRRQWATVPLLQLPRVWATRSTVKGFALGPTDYDLPLSRVTVGG